MSSPTWHSSPDNLYSFLHDATPEQLKALYDALKVRPKNYFFLPQFRAGVSDGFSYYFNTDQKRLLTGLVPFAAQLGFDYPEVVEAVDPLEEFNLEFQLQGRDGPITLTSYQDASVVAVAEGARRGIFDHITASGKTVLMAALCCLLKDLRITITVPSIALLEQTAEDLKLHTGEPIGILRAGQVKTEPRIVVAYDGFIKAHDRSPFIKTLASQTQVLICDELQSVTKRMFPFFRLCKAAYYRFGFSGSFFDIDPERIFSTAGYFGQTITKVTDEDTRLAGRTVPPRFTFYEYPLRKTDLDYSDAYRELIVENVRLNDFFATKLQPAYEAGKTILVLVKRVAHCANFQKALSQLGIDSEIYNGQINTEKRREMRAQFRDGRLPVLVATEQTLGVGVNIPRIELLLNLGGGLSDNASLQKFGRSLRSFSEKESVEILEPYLTCNKWFLRHARARLSIAKRYATGNVRLVLQSGDTHIL